jgi:hypothetical protein
VLPLGVIFFLLLVILIAQIGFWDTFGAVLGAVAMIFILAALITAVVIVGGLIIAGRLRRPP